MERMVVVSNVFGTVEYEVSAGVPQGSVLGPLLWNLVYDQLLEKLDNMVSIKAFAFADDLAITCVVKKNECPSTKVNVMLRIVSNWCASVGLTLARDKTEIMFITGMRVPRVIGLSVGDAETYSVEVIKYLSIIIDSYRKFDRHIVSVCDKADIMAGVLRGILPNINGPPRLARRLYYKVWESIVMYGAPVWARAVNLAKNRRAMKRTQRTALIITSTTYRTVSHTALCVLTGNMPIYIKVKMLKELYEKSRIHKRMVVEESQNAIFPKLLAFAGKMSS
jgi:hypothetical protein